MCRASRLCALQDVTQAEAVLDALARREDGPYVVRLPREPGKRESRYAHLFSGEVDVAELAMDSATAADNGGMAELAQRVAALEAEVAELKALVGALTS